MGIACNLNCGHCSYNQNVFLGIGFNYIHLSSILEWYEEKEGRQYIREFINNKETSFECYDGLYVCQKCCYLLNKVHLHMKSGTQSYTNTHTCPRCNTQMPSKPLVDINQSDVLDCPDCGQEKLKVSFYMDWD